MMPASDRPDHQRVTIIARELVECTSKINSVLANARDMLAEMSLKEFITDKIGTMFSLCFSYSQMFERLDVKDRKNLEALIQWLSRGYPEVIQNYEQLMAAEERWDSFLEDVDKRIAVSDNVDPVNVGDVGPVELELERIHDGKKPEFEAIPADMVIVSFGQRKGAELWTEDIQCTFPILLDPERKVYRFLGLKKSVYRVWATQTMIYYAEQVRAGRELPRAYSSVEDDIHQLAGDLVLDKHGRILLLYRSEMANDRPTVDQLITSCRTNCPVVKHE